jgi:hypothetical protein
MCVYENAILKSIKIAQKAETDDEKRENYRE